MRKTIILFALLTIACINVSAYDYNTVIDGIYYYCRNSEAWVTSGDNKYTGKVTIPSSVQYDGNIYTVIGINPRAFEDCSGLTSVTIPNSVTSIRDYAFKGCSSLTAVTLPNSVTAIGADAFEDCSSLTSIAIPNGVTSIGAFKGCSSLTSVTIPNSVTNISSSAFYGCSSLTSVTIPNSVTYIGGYAFKGCSSLTSVTIPNSVTSIGDGAFSGCRGLTSVNIPNSVPSIGDGTFSGCSGLTSVTIPNSVTSIGRTAFGSCSGLTSVAIPNSVTSIGSAAFCYCSSLTSVIIPNSVTSIHNQTFQGCSSLTSVTIPSSVTSIGSDAFNDCSSLTSVHIFDIAAWCNIAFTSYSKSSNPLYYAKHLFLGEQEIKKLIIPNNITSIKNCAFYGCSGLTSVTIPNSVTSIEYSAFYGCIGLTSVTIPNSVTSIGAHAFHDCSGLTSVTIGNSVNSIGGSAFYGCSGLTSVTIGNSVNSIGGSAFYGCSGLTSVTIPNSVTSIEDSAFENCSSLASVTIPNSVTSIGGKAFYGCSNLNSVHISDLAVWCNIKFGHSYFDSYLIPFNTTHQLFLDGQEIKKLIIPESVTSIGACAFIGCSGLTSVTIPTSVTVIGYRAFAGCSGLTSVSIPNSVTSIGEGAFHSCSGLTSVTIPNGVTSISNYTFTGCSGLTSMTVPNGVTSIGKYAFYYCSGLTSVTIPNSVKSIGMDAFANCQGLIDVYCLATTVPETDATAFSLSSYNYATLHVPLGCKNAYAAVSPWKDFGNIVEFDTGTGQLAVPDLTTFRATAISDNSFMARWGTVSGASFYNIEVKTQGGNYEHPVFKRSVSSNSVEVTGLSPNTYYQFRVRARNGNVAQNSEWSGSILNPVKTNEAGSSSTALAVYKVDGIDGSKRLFVDHSYAYKMWVINTNSSLWKGRILLKEDDQIINEWPNISLSANATQPLEYTYTPTEFGNKALGLYYVTQGTSEEQLVDDGVIFVPVNEEETSVIAGLRLKEAITVPSSPEVGYSSTVVVKVENQSGGNWSGNLYLADNGDIVNTTEVTIESGGNYTAVISDWTPTVEGSHDLSVFYKTVGTEDMNLLDANEYSNPLNIEVAAQYVPVDITEAVMTFITKDCAPAQVNSGDEVYYNFRFTDKNGNPVKGLKAHFTCTGSTKLSYIDTPLSDAKGYSTLIILTEGDNAFANPGQSVKFTCTSLRDVNNREITIRNADSAADCEFNLKLHKKTVFESLESLDLTIDVGLGGKPSAPNKLVSASVDLSFPITASFKWDDNDRLTTGIEHEYELSGEVDVNVGKVNSEIGGSYGTKSKTTYNWNDPRKTALGLFMTLIGADYLYTNKNVLRSILAIEKWFGIKSIDFSNVLESHSSNMTWGVSGKISGKKTFTADYPMADPSIPNIDVPPFETKFKGGFEASYKHDFDKQETDYQKNQELYGFSNSLKTKVFCNFEKTTNELCIPDLLNPIPKSSGLLKIMKGGLFQHECFKTDGYLSMNTEEEEMFTSRDFNRLGKISNSLKIEGGVKLSSAELVGYICPAWVEANKNRFQENDPSVYLAISSAYKWKMSSNGEWAARLQELSNDVNNKSLLGAIYPALKGEFVIESPYNAWERYSKTNGQFKVFNALSRLTSSEEQYPVKDALKIEQQQSQKAELGISLPFAHWKLFGIGIDVILDVGFSLDLKHYPSTSHYSIADQRFFSVVNRKPVSLTTLCKKATEFIQNKIQQAFSDDDKEEVCTEAGELFNMEESELRNHVKELSNKNKAHTTTKTYSAKRRAPKLAAIEQKDICEFTFTINEDGQNFDEGTMITSSHYYPLGKLLGVTQQQDTLFVVSEVFSVDAVQNSDTLKTTQYGQMKLETKIGADDLTPFGFPEDMSLDVYFSEEGSNIWEYVGPAGGVLQVNKLGSYMMATSVKNDTQSPIIEANLNKSTGMLYLNVTDNIAIRANTLKVMINGEVKDFTMVNESNFEVQLSSTDANSEFVLNVYVNDLAGNQGTLMQVFNPSNYENTEPDEPATELADGIYYLRNVATQKFWGAANNWGTRASLVDEYQYVKLARQNDGRYTMETMVTDGGSRYYFAGDYMDGNPVSLTITPTGKYYTISLDGNYFGYDGTSTILGKRLSADDENALWQAMTEADVQAEQDAIMNKATVKSPADVSFLIRDAGFGRNRRDVYQAWQMDASNQDLTGGADYDHPNSCGESWHSTFTLSQTIPNLPQGVYQLKAQGFYRQEGSNTVNLPYFYINDAQRTFPKLEGTDNTMTEAGISFDNGLYWIEPIYTELAAPGTITVGAKLEGNYYLWCIWDNFHLTYYGRDSKLSDVLSGGIPVGISNRESEQPTSDVFYDLSGRRINNPRQQGLYLRRGKKFVITGKE